MGKYDGKKLLILGNNAGSAEILEYAKQNGAYIVVSDYIPYEESKLKKEADEHLSVSTAETEELADYIKTNNINGVIAGISEFNLNQAMLLSDMCSLPYYCTKEQWDLVNNKKNFRKLCEKFYVPCPKTYFKDTAEFPCVLKPVDSCASQGVFICRDRRELEQRIPQAVSFSSSEEIIIEEFAEGVEFSAHYTISNGKATLSSIDNRYPVKVHEGEVTSIPIARIYPCSFIDSYLKQVNQPMLRFCEGIGLTDSLLFIQGIYNTSKDTFYIFEAGLRSAAETPFRFISLVNGTNPIEVIIDHNLLGHTDYDLSKENPFINNKCCGVISFVAKSGTVEKIKGLEDTVRQLSSIVRYELRYFEGDKIPDTDTLRQIIMRFVMICDSREDMINDIEYLNKHIDVFDNSGKSLLIKMDPERIRGLI